MAKKYTITNFTPGTNGTFSIAGDVTAVFKPSSTGVVATAFDVVGSQGLDGRYSVVAAAYVAGKTQIQVNTDVPSGTISTGKITNCSVYRLTTPENDNVVVVDAKEEDASTSLEFVGRSSSGWGETIQQNLLSMLCNFSSPTPPVNPVNGQMWFDESTSLLKIWVNSWQILNQVASATNQLGSFVTTQPTASTTWTITHNLNSTNLIFNVLVDVGAGVLKPIMPGDVTFTSNNVLTLTFSTARSGKISIVRAAG